MITIEKVYEAQKVLKNVIRPTGVIAAPKISRQCGADVYLKPENLQVTGAFKVRGAFYKFSTLTDDEKARGVVACSAGNHAQGVALSAQIANVKAKIYMPATAPLSKVEETKRYGAEVVLVNGVYDDAYLAALEDVKTSGAVFIHPFDDEDVIAGQGTIGLEIYEDFTDVEAIVVPIGGGGLAAGLAFAIKTLDPDCKVYGVQAENAAALRDSYKAGKIVNIDTVATFADGIAVKSPGKITFDLCHKYLDDIVTVSEDEIATAILSLIENQKMTAEGAGAVALAAVMFDKVPVKGKKVLCLVSGGNIDVTILSRVVNRGLVTSGRLSELKIALLDRPGELARVSSIISDSGANVVHVTHKREGEHSSIKGCHLHISIETRNFDHLEAIKKSLRDNGYELHN